MRLPPSTMKPMNSSASVSSLPLYRRSRSWLKLTMLRSGSCRSWDATYANRCSSSFDRRSSPADRASPSSASFRSVTSRMTETARISPRLSVKSAVVTSPGKVLPSFRRYTSSAEAAPSSARCSSIAANRGSVTSRIASRSWPTNSSSVHPSNRHAAGFAARMRPSSRGSVRMIASRLYS